MEHDHSDKKDNYRPLFVLLALITLAAMAMVYGRYILRPADFMRYFMGLFFLQFAMFKLFDLKGFADGFQMYDLLAKPFRPYAYVYPLLELALGLLYLSGTALQWANIATLALMAFSAVGVLRGIRSKMDIRCACLGTVLNVPLSTVSAVENIGMGLMAAAMLAQL